MCVQQSPYGSAADEFFSLVCRWRHVAAARHTGRGVEPRSYKWLAGRGQHPLRTVLAIKMPPIGRHFAVISSAEVEVLFRVGGRAVDANLEVQVRSRGVAGGADIADGLPLRDGGAVGNGEAAHVRV